MSTKTKAPSRTPPPGGPILAVSWSTPPRTAEERLQRIEALDQQIAGHIRFLRQVVSTDGTSAEVKERAVTAFYERMVVAQDQLNRIQEDLRLT